MRLRTKFAIALLAITLLLSAATFAGLEFYKSQAVTEVRGNVEETSSVIADQIDSTLRERRDFVGYVASRPRAGDFATSGGYLEAFLTNSRFYAAQVIARNGTVMNFRGGITEEQRQQVIGRDRSDAPYFQRGLEGASIGTAEYAQRPNRPDTYALVFSAPVFDADREVKGVFAAALYLTEDTVFDMVPAAETSTQSVTITGGSTPPLHQSDRQFNQTVRSSATVDTTGWTVTVERDRSGLNSRLEQLALFQGGGLLLVLFSMIGFGYWQYSVSLRQTERLLEGFGRIREGDYDYSVSLGGGTEWERIGDGVNELADGLRQREAALRERQQRLEVLHRVLRHNVRNRMSIVLNYAGIIRDMSEDDMLADAAGTIEDAGQDLNRLSEKARQVETAFEESDPEPEPVDAARVARETVDDAREDYPDVDVSVAAPDAAWALALPSLRLAVENAVENACEHNDSEEPEVTVTVSGTADGTGQPDPAEAPGENGAPGDGRVRVAVADNGPGIPEQDRNVIEEGRETDLEHGSGLGLWVLYWIVDSSGGEVLFEENDPEGTVVTIDLDAAPADRRSEDSGDAEPPASESEDDAGGEDSPSEAEAEAAADD